MSELKIVYVQWLLSGKKFSFSSRLNFIYDSFSFGNVVKSAKNSEKCIKASVNKLHWKRVSNKKKMDNFCREYLLLTDKLDSIFTNDFYSYKQNDIQLSVEYLLNTNKVNLSNVIVDKLKNELHSIKNSKEEKELQDQNEDFLRVKLNQLFKLY